MDFYVVSLAGKQHLISGGDVFSVEANLGEVGKKIVLDQVLLTSVGEKIVVGTPLVSGAKAMAEIVFSGKGEKIRVAKFKSKVRYRKVIGFRPLLTKLKVLSLGEEEKPVKTAKSEKDEKDKKDKKGKLVKKKAIK
jgi:large subunit ribosomal protein L21